MKFKEWVKGIENAAIKGLCSTHPNICKMIYNEGQKDIEKALKDKGVCLQSELDEAIEIIKELKAEISVTSNKTERAREFLWNNTQDMKYYGGQKHFERGEI